MKKLYWAVFSLSLFYTVRRNVRFFASLQHGNHTEVFFYLANVENFHSLNPTIINVTYSERFNDENFYVEYTEYLSQVRVVTNHNQAHYRIQKEDDGAYSLISQHTTCFFTRFLCLPTESKLHITKLLESEVGYKEEILYSCPWLLLRFCFDEISIQRKLIIEKLRELFHHPN